MRKLSLIVAGLAVMAFSGSALASSSTKPADTNATHDCPFGGHDKTAEKPKTS